MVCFAWARRGRDTVVATRQLAGDRTQVRVASVSIALRGLLDIAQKT
jgi:nicotinamide mononucleotide (NMN) deamidase PncC